MKDLQGAFDALEAEKADRIAEETGELLAEVNRRRAAVDAEFAERLEIVEKEAVRAVIERLPAKTHLVYIDYRDGEYWNDDLDRCLLSGDHEALIDLSDGWIDERYENATEKAEQVAGDLWEHLSDAARDEIRYEVEARDVADPVLEMAEFAGTMWLLVDRDDWTAWVALDRADLYRNAWRKDLRIWVTGLTEVGVNTDAYGYSDWARAEISLVLTRDDLTRAEIGYSAAAPRYAEQMTVRILNDNDALAVEAYLTGDRYQIAEMAAA